MFGLRGLAAVLNDHFLLLSHGHRTAQPRQQSLLGALEWSYRLLSAVEQTILHRLAVFRRDFTLEAATEVAAGDGISVEQIYAGMLTLSTKSLVTTDISAEAPQHYHRLLHVTRSFVPHKLGEFERERPSPAGTPTIFAARCARPPPTGKRWSGSSGSKFTLA